MSSSPAPRATMLRFRGTLLLSLTLLLSSQTLSSHALVTHRPPLFSSSSLTARPLPRVQMSSTNALYMSSSTSPLLDGHLPKKKRRKRDILHKCWGSASSRLSLTCTPLRHRSFASVQLHGQKNDDDSSKSSNDDDNDSAFQASLNKFKSDVAARLPPALLEFWQSFLEKLASVLPTLRTAALSFLAGAVLTLAAILVPVYHQVEALTEPVTLFETILGDLESRYVDNVDTNRLFETGVSAMLKSLDPYTEFEPARQAQELSESIGGKYGGVGLVISGATPRDLELLQQQEQQKEDETGTSTTTNPSNSDNNNFLLPQDALDDQERLKEPPQAYNAPVLQDASSTSSLSRNYVNSNNNNNKALASSSFSSSNNEDDDDDEDVLTLQDQLARRKALQRARERGIRVVSAFEGYAFDYGMRVGDKLVKVNEHDILAHTPVEQVRNYLRGDPGTYVTIEFEREGVDGVQSVTMPRTIVQIRDVKLATLLGNPKDGIGYIQLTGFAADAGREMRNAIFGLQRLAEAASGGEHSLKGLILDLRGNPGGLLTSAVDVSSLLVPKGSDIVSAKGRGFPGVLYRSRVDPILGSDTKLAVLVNDATASAAEIVSGAVQDLDVGVIVGSDRTFGKGLVQNVEDLPFNTALKYTVAKYYTPSGRCIQGVNYQEGGSDDGAYKASKVADKDRTTYYTRLGRQVKDGGGIEADYKVAAPKASALEVTLLRSGAFSDFAAKWSREHELTNNFEIDDNTYRQFQAFVNQKQKDGEIKLESLYSGAIRDLRKILKASGYKGSTKELEQLETTIVREIQKDFDKYRSDIKEDLQQSILARYLPESMLIERGVKADVQVKAAMKLVSNGSKFDNLLARGSASESQRLGAEGTLSTAVSSVEKPKSVGKLNVQW